MQSSLDFAHWRVLLGNIRDFRDVNDYDRKYLIRRAFEFLDRDLEDLTNREYRARLYLAAHFSPKSALDYDLSSVPSRFELIDDYLTNEMGFDTDNTQPLSRAIARLLDTWEKERDGTTTSHLDRLLRNQDHTCNHCHVSFDEAPASVEAQDPYKPYHPKVEERLSPEVDHIEPVSSWGTNNFKNLQVLCRLCNYGKGNGLGVDTALEMQNSAKSIEELSWSYTSKIIYYVIKRFKSKCSSCGSNKKELTVRPINDRGGLIQSNLKSLCVECAYKNI